MLTRNCEIANLFNEGDFNARVTVFNPANVSDDPIKQKTAWVEMINTSIGKSITRSSNICELTISKTDGSVVSYAVTREKYVLGNIVTTFEKPQPIRVSIKPLNSKNERVWIFI